MQAIHFMFLIMLLPAIWADDSCCKLMRTFHDNKNEAYNVQNGVYGVYSKNENDPFNGMPTFTSIFAQGAYTIWFNDGWVVGNTHDHKVLLKDGSHNADQYTCPDNMPTFNWKYLTRSRHGFKPAYDGFGIGCISDYGRELNCFKCVDN